PSAATTASTPRTNSERPRSTPARTPRSVPSSTARAGTSAPPRCRPAVTSSRAARRGVAAHRFVDHDPYMLGLMQDIPLTTSRIFERGARFFGTKTVTTKTATGVERTTFADLAAESRKVAAAIDSLDISADARVATFAWNSARHLGLYFAIPNTGRVIHTGNIRYFPEQLIYTFEHAEDE